MHPHPHTSAPLQRRTLVSGGAGFIGSHLVEDLLARGDHVTVVDDLSTGRRENLPRETPGLRFIEADLRDALSALGRGEVFDEIYHLAAAVGVKLVVEDPARAIETNVEQTSAILRFARHRSARGGAVPVLVASSSEVYGKSAKDMFSEDDDVVYGPTTVARWSYAYGKAIDEHLALAYCRDRGVPTVVARFFNTVGPRQIGDYGMVLPRFVGAAIRGRPIDVHGDGRQSRCFCDVRDVATVLPRMLGERACHGGVFNVGSDRPVSIRDLADLVVRVTGSASPVRLIPYADAFGPGFEDLRQRRPDLRKIRDAVGFEPGIALEKTVADVARWMTLSGSAEAAA